MNQPPTLSLDQARRLALAAQGFGDPRPPGRVDVRHLRRVFRRVGLVQLDAVNVLVRAHYMPFFSRLGPYPRRLLDDLAHRRRELFEYWGHMASLLPVSRYPLFRPRMAAAGAAGLGERATREFIDYVEAVRAELGRRGALSTGELEDPGRRTGPWWGYAKGKVALEWLFRTGEVAVSERRGFTRVYDLADRVVPPDVRQAPAIPTERAQLELVRLAAQSQGVATAEDLADYYRLERPATQRCIEQLVQTGELQPVGVAAWTRPAYMWAAARAPRTVRARALLNPFDPLVWTRDRVRRLFGFDYRIEIYVPAAKRRHGYYVLPFLLGEELVARVDLKAQRRARTLLVRGAFGEHGRDGKAVARELALELRCLAAWLDLERVAVSPRGDLAHDLRAAVERVAAP